MTVAPAMWARFVNRHLIICSSCPPSADWALVPILMLLAYLLDFYLIQHLFAAGTCSHRCRTDLRHLGLLMACSPLIAVAVLFTYFFVREALGVSDPSASGPSEREAFFASLLGDDLRHDLRQRTSEFLGMPGSISRQESSAKNLLERAAKPKSLVGNALVSALYAFPLFFVLFVPIVRSQGYADASPFMAFFFSAALIGLWLTWYLFDAMELKDQDHQPIHITSVDEEHPQFWKPFKPQQMLISFHISGTRDKYSSRQRQLILNQITTTACVLEGYFNSGARLSMVDRRGEVGLTITLPAASHKEQEAYKERLGSVSSANAMTALLKETNIYGLKATTDVNILCIERSFTLSLVDCLFCGRANTDRCLEKLPSIFSSNQEYQQLQGNAASTRYTPNVLNFLAVMSVFWNDVALFTYIPLSANIMWEDVYGPALSELAKLLRLPFIPDLFLWLRHLVWGLAADFLQLFDLPMPQAWLGLVYGFATIAAIYPIGVSCTALKRVTQHMKGLNTLRTKLREASETINNSREALEEWKGKKDVTIAKAHAAVQAQEIRQNSVLKREREANRRMEETNSRLEGAGLECDRKLTADLQALSRESAVRAALNGLEAQLDRDIKEEKSLGNKAEAVEQKVGYLRIQVTSSRKRIQQLEQDLRDTTQKCSECVKNVAIARGEQALASEKKSLEELEKALGSNELEVETLCFDRRQVKERLNGMEAKLGEAIGTLLSAERDRQQTQKALKEAEDARDSRRKEDDDAKEEHAKLAKLLDNERKELRKLEIEYNGWVGYESELEKQLNTALSERKHLAEELALETKFQQADLELNQEPHELWVTRAVMWITSLLWAPALRTLFTVFDCKRMPAADCLPMALEVYPEWSCFSSLTHIGLAVSSCIALILFFPTVVVARGFFQLLDADITIKHQQRHLMLLAVSTTTIMFFSTIASNKIVLKLSINLIVSLFMLGSLLYFYEVRFHPHLTELGHPATYKHYNACTWPLLLKVKAGGYAAGALLSVGGLAVESVITQSSFSTGAYWSVIFVAGLVELSVLLLLLILAIWAIKLLAAACIPRPANVRPRQSRACLMLAHVKSEKRQSIRRNSKKKRS